MNDLSPLNDELFERVHKALPEDAQVYVVGGCLRDYFLGINKFDYDFAIQGDSLALARRVANKLGAAYFPLDLERQTARLILNGPESKRIKLDFAGLRGPDIESDLRGRDFTINALAMPLAGGELIDPTGGLADLQAKVLRPCSDSAFQDDPVRVVRAARFATSLSLRIPHETAGQIRQAASLLETASPERIRDELFRVLEGRQIATAIRLLDYLEALAFVIPEILELKGVIQSPPHIQDVWEHTLDLTNRLEQVLDVLGGAYDQEKAANWAMGLVSVQLGRFREQLQEHLAVRLNPDRSLRSLIFFSVLYHDSGKTYTHKTEENGRIRFFDHEMVSERLATERLRQLRLSNDEIERVSVIVRSHMRPLLLAQTGTAPTRRAIYRYFRATGQAGVDVGLLALADCLATYGATLPADVWAQLLEVVRELFSAWWENPQQAVNPPRLVTGSELMEMFGLKPGPKVGKLLDEIREAQATGQVETREQAITLARELLGESDQ